MTENGDWGRGLRVEQTRRGQTVHDSTMDPLGTSRKLDAQSQRRGVGAH